MQDGGGLVVVRGGLGVEDDQGLAGRQRDVAEAGGRVDLQRRADGEEEVGCLGRGDRRVEDALVERLAEGDGRGLEDAAADLAGRVLVAGFEAGEYVGHRDRDGRSRGSRRTRPCRAVRGRARGRSRPSGAGRRRSG